MNEDLQQIVVRVIPNHPTGTRRRAGFKFTQDPVVVSVNTEQLEAIKNDPYLKIITKGTAFEQGLQNSLDVVENDQQKSDTPTCNGKTFEETKKAELIEILENLKVEFKSTSNKQELWDLLNSLNSQSLSDVVVELTKDQIISKLIEKGLQEGIDFNSEADEKDLLLLLNN